jgi:hypothetical protein
VPQGFSPFHPDVTIPLGAAAETLAHYRARNFTESDGIRWNCEVLMEELRVNSEMLKNARST